MASQQTCFASLPNELVIQILASFNTRALLQLATISHRIHDLVLRLLHHRLLAAAGIEDHKLILECYHPSAKWSTPGLPCEYLSTDSLSGDTEGQEFVYDDVQISGRLGKLVGLYSHFRPQEAEQSRRTRRPHPAGDVPGHPNTSSSQDLFDSPQIPSHNIHLESYERFSQLVTVANLVKVGPRAGLFLSCVTIGEGVIRIFRNWLAEHAITRGEADKQGPRMPSKGDDERMLWLDDGKNVGVRLRVVHSEDLYAGPVLQSRDEDPAVSYTLEYEELVIRSTKLLLMVERSLQQESDHTGKALIIGSWRQEQEDA